MMHRPRRLPWIWIGFFIAIFAVSIRSYAADGAAGYFAIEVVDEQTGRGVPLVELTTTNQIHYFTDSAGLVAFGEPGLLGRRVFFTISSHGYEFPKDGFGIRGVALETKPGGSVKLKIKRINIAQRLYRITGQGIYVDTELLGRKAPVVQPLLNAGVLGQDSVLAEVFRGKIYWFWGDTSQAAYPLGNFSMTGATSALPSNGGLDPSTGVNLDYYADGKGFVKKMAPLPDPGPVWVDGIMVLKDDAGEDRMLAHYSRMKDLGTRLERGLMAWNDQSQQLEKIKSIALDAPLAPGGHPFHAKVDGVDYFYFPVPYPAVRVPANWKAATDLNAYEALTCLAQGERYAKDSPKLDLDESGHARFSWKQSTPPLDSRQMHELIDSGKLRREDCPFRLEDASTHKPVLLHGGSVYFNEFRKRWIMIGLEGMGSSMLGEIWYAESAEPAGPWVSAVKIVTHDKMDFYNPTQHPFFDQQGGKIIYFEGTYTNTFSGNPCQTPRYEYNQIMYKLDLSDARLKPAQASQR
jgi:hypothetical protein